MKQERRARSDIFVGKDFFDGASIFEDGLPIFVNRATKQRPPELQVHTHDFIEIAYVMFGEGEHQIAGQSFPVQKGDLYIINPGVPHRFVSDDKYADDDFMICNVAFSTDLIGEATLRLGKQIRLDDVFLYSAFFENNNSVPFRSVRLSGNTLTRVEQIYEDIYHEYQLKCAGYEHVMFSQLTILLVLVLRQITHCDHYGSEYEKEVISQAIHYIDEHFTDSDLTLEDMASRAFLSKNYFGKLFREYANQKFTSYVQNKRISAACEMLTSSDRKVTDIIEMVGYHDIKYFNEIFKRTTGKTPSAYRQHSRRALREQKEERPKR